jgi:hypothetical protein
MKAAWRIQDCDYSWEDLSTDEGERIYCKIVLLGGSLRIEAEGSTTVIIWSEYLSALWGKYPRLSSFGGRISPACGGRIHDCHYLVGVTLQIVVRGFKIFIILWENLSGLWG